MGSSGIEIFIAGVAIGAVAILVFFAVFHPAPIFMDCGCGAMSAMCGQCIHGGNLSAPICGAFK